MIRCGATPTNNSLQVTFDPPPSFAAAKAGVASNTPELRRDMTQVEFREAIAMSAFDPATPARDS